MKSEYKALVLGVAGALILLLVALTILSSNQYLTVSELYRSKMVDSEVVVMGRVANDSIRYVENRVEFVIFDENSTGKESVKVVYVGGRNIDVYEGAVVVVKGEFNGTTIVAREVMTKCPSAYKPANVTG